MCSLHSVKNITLLSLTVSKTISSSCLSWRSANGIAGFELSSISKSSLGSNSASFFLPSRSCSAWGFRLPLATSVDVSSKTNVSSATVDRCVWKSPDQATRRRWPCRQDTGLDSPAAAVCGWRTTDLSAQHHRHHKSSQCRTGGVLGAVPSAAV